jgi:hypothetical protein
MRLRASITFCVLLAVGAATTSTCSAQVIQLPTFHYFTVSTTVSVPDSGGAFLGGVKRARYGMTSRGIPGLNKVPGISRLFRNRGSGASLTSAGASVTATIIDHAEMDALLLGEAAGRRPAGTALTATDRKALILSSHIGRPSEAGLRLGGGAPRESVAAIRVRNAEVARAHSVEMQKYWQRAQEAESLNRMGAARVCYDIIVRRGSGELRDQAAVRLAQLRAPAKATAPGQRSTNHATISAAAKTGTLVSGRSNRLP